MHKLFFWLNWHVGDLVLTRPLIRRVLDSHDVQIVYGCWENQAYLIEDLPIQIVVDPRNDPRRGDLPEPLLHLCPPGHFPIYLWIGSYPEIAHHNWATMVEIYNRQVESHGLGELKIRSDWVPMVDFPPMEVTVAHNSIFVENGVARSKHSDFEFDIESLSTQFPKLNFYCTSDPKCRRPNVVDCSTYNLKTLSSIGNRCLAIIGKGSGPFCSTLTEVNRYKPRAIMRYHPRDAGNAIWDYPGNPMQYLETDDDVRAFLTTVERREILSLVPGVRFESTKPAIAPECEVARLDVVIDQFQRFPSDIDCRQAYVEAHQRVLRLWRETPDDLLEYSYRGALGKATRRLLAINAWNLIAGQPRSNDLSNARGTRNESESPGGELRSLICSMLSATPSESRPEIDFKHIPVWLRSDLLGFLHRYGDVWEHRDSVHQRFIEHEKLLGNLATTFENEPVSPYHKHFIKQIIENDQLPYNIASDDDWTSIRQNMGRLL